MKRFQNRVVVYLAAALFGASALAGCAVHTRGVVTTQPKAVVVVHDAPAKVYYQGRWLYYRDGGYMYYHSSRWVYAHHVPTHVARYHKPRHVHAKPVHVRTRPVHRSGRPVHVSR